MESQGAEDYTREYDVPLMVTRGYPSLSYLHSAAATIQEELKKRWGGKATVYYFGDFDPSDLDISRNTEQRLQQFVDSDALAFKRVAVNEDQIAELLLPTRPTKATNSRS